MKPSFIRNNRWKFIVGLMGLLIVLTFSALLAYRLITGQSLGLRSFLSSRTNFITNPARAIIGSSAINVASQGEFSNIIFLHHSTGNNLIRHGGVRELFAQEGYSFWDHGYNFQGLRGPDGKGAGYHYNIPGDNTNPGGLARIFRQNEYSLPVNAFSGLLQHEVVVFKPCFAPANHITSDAQLEKYKDWYLEMRDVMDGHTDKIFIVVTVPPLNPAETNSEEATRARAFANWLGSDEYLGGHPNVYTFDIFDLLAEDDLEAPDVNMLRESYRDGSDSHPNRLANETIGPIFVDSITGYIQELRAIK